MGISPTPAKCGSHACDCFDAVARPEADGVLLIAERQHVRAKVGDLLGQDGDLQLIGADWPERLAELLAALTFSERAALLVAPLDGGRPGIALTSEIALERARSPWLPALLDDGRLYPHLQPIVSLGDGTVYGYESLIRGRVGEAELSGAEIVSAARAHGALFTLDRVGRTVALEQGMGKLRGEEVLFVNFTPTAIYDPEVCLRTTWAIAQRHGLPMERICFEVVETEQFPDLAFLQRILDEYRRRGAMVALDDLGAGHSSLSYLAALRPDVVKLDRELIAGIDGDPARQRLVGALVDYAHELGVRVVAEGIENASELAAVRAQGADLGQGWYLGRPAAERVEVDRRLVLEARTRVRDRTATRRRRSAPVKSAVSQR
jgi:EAL domain-containing protein (putative c-di-GMP-specific phosphodiesterase class I)